MRALLAGLSLLSVTGCGGPPRSFNVPVSWVFIDGRACAEAEVLSVTLQQSGWSAVRQSPCLSGQAGGQVQVMSIKAGVALVAEGLSASSDVLYRAQAFLEDPPPPKLVITLDYVGGH